MDYTTEEADVIITGLILASKLALKLFLQMSEDRLHLILVLESF